MKIYKKGTILRSTTSTLELTLTKDQVASSNLTGVISKAASSAYYSVGNHSNTWNGCIFTIVVYEAKKNIKVKSLLTPTLR